MSDDAAVVADGSISTKKAVPLTTIRNGRIAADPRSGRGRDAEPDPGRGPAVTIAVGVRDGVLLPSRVVAEAATRISVAERDSDAFRVVRAERAMAEAAALEERDDLDVLPLAGVPIAVEHGALFAGEPVPWGSVAAADHPVVARLRGAGAVVVGLVAGGEFGRWGTNDGAGPVVRNPWNSTRNAGGPAAAAVAAGLVPVAHGSDGLGSVRVAAACCGVFGIKPGCYTGAAASPALVENGVLATTVQDAALALSVLAARPNLAEVDPPGRLRIALAVDPPSRLVHVDRHWTAAARRAASVAAAAGHLVETTTLPYGNALFEVFLRWLAVGAREAPALPQSARLSRRTRLQLALGRMVHQSQLICPAQIDRVEARLLEFFDRYDVVITPTLAAPPPTARAWHSRNRPAPLLGGARFAPFTSLWNLVGWPAASVPMGMHPSSGTPVAAQLAGPPGSESTLLRLAAQLETRHPWQRTAP
ncbi:amidase family protein [Nocardia sp. NBC_00508]|uniref:amidase family protein n=1 Tax=Nocardia sp. NBC_00508 TaxID=2975992 RepID=UPI002E8027AB|nr:amidase family protein [Nocardia sp. NBC_00508]WUD63650.1 amidase family protein [Nocardia sp. NBC_00508]